MVLYEVTVKYEKQYNEVFRINYCILKGSKNT